jgi:hypothetical protein
VARVPGALPLGARAADALVAALVLLALFVEATGGGVLRLGGSSLSVTSPWRVLAWAGVVLIVRHALVRQQPFPLSIVRALRSRARAAGPLPQETPENEITEQHTDGDWWTKPVWALTLAAILYVALTAAMTYPQARFLNQTVVPEFGDPLLSTWRLAWVAHQLPREPLRLFDANIFYPDRRTLAFSDAMIVPSLTVAPLVWLGVHQVIAYNILLLSGFVLSGIGMFVLVRSLTGHIGAALLAGLVFAFLPYRYMHYSHVELQQVQWMPLCLWALHRTVATGRIRDGILAGVFFTLQTLSSLYYGIFFATYLAVVAPIVLLGTDRAKAMRAARPLAAGFVLAMLLTIPFTIPYIRAREAVGERKTEDIQSYSATPSNYLAAPFWNEMFGKPSWRQKLGGPERDLFQGIAAPLIAVVGLWPPLSAARMAYVCGFALAFDASLGYNGYVYPFLHTYVFPYRGLRVPARMGILVGLSLAILVGYGAARIATVSPRRWLSAVALMTLAGGILLEYRTTVKLRHVWSEPPPVYEALPRTSHVIFEMPFVDPDTTLEPIYMYFSTFHWHKLANGYSGFSPRSHQELLDLMPTFPDDAGMEELRRRGVDTIVVHGAFHRSPEVYQDLVTALDQRNDVALVRTVKWQGHESRVYQMVTRSVSAQ